MPSANEATPAPCDWEGTAPLLLSANLDAQSERVYQEHLDMGCNTCQIELEQAREVNAAFDLAHAAAQPSAPPAHVKQRLLERVRPAGEEENWRAWTPQINPNSEAGLHTRPADDGDWQATDIAGIFARALRVDEERRLVTMMVRMDPGTEYPAHRHAATEECYVISGDLRVGERVLHAGDFQYADAGSLHGPQSTESGCTLLLISSQDDVRI